MKIQSGNTHPPELLVQVAALPALPGVYRYFDADGALLYVGKAIHLKRRVSSYFQRNHAGTRTGHMVAQIVTMETTVVRTEVEALLLENNLIKALNPKYNILFKDDKSYPYLKISTASPVARISYHRGGVDKKNSYFGPYPNGWAVKQALALLQKVFLLRSCEDSVFANRTRPCLMHQIKRCSGPCVPDLTGTTIPIYRSDVHHAEQFLRGETQLILQTLEAQMQACAEQLEFEKAADIRNRLRALASILQQQSVDTTGGDANVDILAVKIQGGKACVNLAMVRNGRHLGDRAYFPWHVHSSLHADQDSNHESPDESQSNDDGIETSDTHKNTSPEQQILQAFVVQHYLQMQVMLPPCLVTATPIDRHLLMTIATHTGIATKSVHQPKGQRRIWLDMAQQNANLQLSRLLSEEGSQKMRTQALVDALGLMDDLEFASASNFDDTDKNKGQLLADFTIECFDVSHTAGEATQASCVVFAGHAMQSSRYRRYNIEGITGGDDYAAMRQVLLRRYGKAKIPHVNALVQQLPNLVLIDGGKGQISTAKSVFEELGLPLGLLVGVEKGEGRKVGLEELVFADGRAKVSLGKDSSALMLIAQIRDEAHRFAITGMRAKRASIRTGTGASQLEAIAGVGAKRRAALLKRFGGVKGVSLASVSDLSGVDGISYTLAQAIYQALHT